MTRLLAVVLFLAALASRAEAQGIGPVAKYGKWVLLAGSIGMNYLAVREHNRADDAFDAVEANCIALPSRCALGAGGGYVDPAIENLYQTSLHYDRRARYWLIGGEVALAGAAALFIWELTRPKRRPDNIPFEPEVRSLRAATGLGLRVGF